MVFDGTGILMSSMQVPAEEEDDFNLWFDTEHLPERVAIPGFLDARRYESLSTPTRYLQIYSATDIAVLDSAPYRAALARQTDWSMHHITRFIAPTRVVGRLVSSRGSCRGVAVVLVRLRPRAGMAMQPALDPYLGLVDAPGVLSVHFVEADAELSKPVTVTGAHPGSEDCYVVIECTGVEAACALEKRLPPVPDAYGALVDVATYRFRLHLSASTLAKLQAASAPPAR